MIINWNLIFFTIYLPVTKWLKIPGKKPYFAVNSPTHVANVRWIWEHSKTNCSAQYSSFFVVFENLDARRPNVSFRRLFYEVLSRLHRRIPGGSKSDIWGWNTWGNPWLWTKVEAFSSKYSTEQDLGHQLGKHSVWKSENVSIVNFRPF